MREESCGRGNHIYKRLETCIGVIYQCQNCINWTRKPTEREMAKILRFPEAKFIPGRKLNRRGGRKHGG